VWRVVYSVDLFKIVILYVPVLIFDSKLPLFGTTDIPKKYIKNGTGRGVNQNPLKNIAQFSTDFADNSIFFISSRRLSAL
jgi:hypothetical protein